MTAVLASLAHDHARTDDAALRTRLCSGDPTSISECYALYGDLVRRYVARYVAHHEVDDVTQRVFFELWRASARYDPERSLGAWLLGIARKRAIDQLRTRPKAGAVVTLDGYRDLAGVDGRDTEERSAAAATVADALVRLPVAQSTVLRLAYFDGYTQSEIAGLLAIPLGTVKTRTARGLRELARILAQR